MTKSPLLNATVSICTDKGENTTYAITAESGLCRFTVDTGNYVCQFSHVNYGAASIYLSIRGDTILGDYFLRPVVKNLSTVTVTAQKRAIEQKGEKLILNLENDPAAKSESALDLLRRAPFVSVDGNDQVRVNGQNSFQVLLNGRQTSLFAANPSDALKGFPGHAILKIEVSPSPSAKYDGEGSGGVINIITKNRLEGYNGSITSFYNTNSYVSTSVRFSAKFKKFGVIAYYGYTHNPLPYHFVNRTTAKQPTVYAERSLEGTRFTRLQTPVGNAEFVWEPDSLNAVSFYNTLSGGRTRSDIDQIAVLRRDSLVASDSRFQIQTVLTFPVVEYGVDYTKRFKNNPEQEISFRVNLQTDENNNTSVSELYNPASVSFVQNSNSAKNDQYTFQGAYVHPLSKASKIEAGLKGTYRHAFSNYSSRAKDDATSDFVVNPANTDHFTYSQNILGLYGLYSLTAKRTDYVFGLRVERTFTKGAFKSSPATFIRHYTNLLPNLQIARHLNGYYTVVLSYSKRLQRPFISNLNPFVNNIDSFNISYGNPSLNSQTTHQVLLQARRSKGAFFVSFGLTWNYSNDLIITYKRLNPASGIITTTSGNIGREQQWGALLFLNTKLNQSWNLTVTSNVYWITNQNKLDKEQINHSIGTNGTFGSSYNVTSKLVVMANAGFSGYPSGFQDKQSINGWYNSGFNYKLFNNKLIAGLRLANYFTPHIVFKFSTDDSLFYNRNNLQLNTNRSAAVMLTWNFGNLKENLSKKKGVQNDDLIQHN